MLVGELLRSRGAETLTARDANNLGHSDSAQLAYAASREMALLTHNRGDFEALHLRLPEPGPHSLGNHCSRAPVTLRCHASGVAAAELTEC